MEASSQPEVRRICGVCGRCCVGGGPGSDGYWRCKPCSEPTPEHLARVAAYLASLRTWQDGTVPHRLGRRGLTGANPAPVSESQSTLF